MFRHDNLTDCDLWQLIKNKGIVLGGNAQLKIYGTLGCKSGKRLKRTNRVFFTSENEALERDFRPCGHCLKKAYDVWKKG
jgi:methylphosphotriester-DNA--protein-cysteine methyltransferase